VLEGADHGIPAEPPIPPWPISYYRSLPRHKATQPKVFVAYQINGRDPSKDQLFPNGRDAAFGDTTPFTLALQECNHSFITTSIGAIISGLRVSGISITGTMSA